jgi:predicted Zn-dependent protease
MMLIVKRASRRLPLLRVIVLVLVLPVSSAMAGVSAQGSPAASSSSLAAASQRATAAMNDGRYEEAARIYTDMLKARPDDGGLLMNLGIALAMAGREAAAIEPLTRAIKLRPTLIPAHMFLGSSYLALGSPEKAIAPLERASAARPGDGETLGLLAQARLATGDAVGAVTAFRRLADATPKLPAAWYGLGQAYNALAQQALETFAADPPDSPWRALLLADALREDGRLSAAFGAYRALGAEAPAPRAVQDAIASIYEKSGHADWAATIRKRAAAIPVDCLANKPECDFRASRYRTVIAGTARKKDAASRYWRTRAATTLTREAFAQLEKLPDSRERREMRAELARIENRHADSIAEIKAALTFAPDDRRLLEELATSQYLARDYETAAATTKALLANDPESASLLALHGEALLELQQLDTAIPALERALALDATDAAARVALGRAYVLAGKHTQAIPLLEPALDDDEDGTLHFQLARALQGAGQADKAKPVLEKYQQLQQAAARRNEGAKETAITPP